MPRDKAGQSARAEQYRRFPWPLDASSGEAPIWTGAGFLVGGVKQTVLQFGESQGNWSDELTEMHEREANSNHPIDVASRSLAIRSVRRYGSKPDSVVLDVGCSSGFLIETLRKDVPEAVVIGSDYLAAPLYSLAERLQDVPLLQFDICRCPLPGDSVDVVVALNVLEHIADDRMALSEIARILKPGGIAYIEVPSNPDLYDIYDECLMHCRRYRLKELGALVQSVGFNILQATHLGFFIYPAFRWVKQRNRRLLSLDADAKRAMVASQIRRTGNSPLLRLLLGVESGLGRIVSYAFGVRCVLVLTKPLDE